jgi:hypothetical protein
MPRRRPQLWLLVSAGPQRQRWCPFLGMMTTTTTTQILPGWKRVLHKITPPIPLIVGKLFRFGSGGSDTYQYGNLDVWDANEANDNDDDGSNNNGFLRFFRKKKKSRLAAIATAQIACIVSKARLDSYVIIVLSSLVITTISFLVQCLPPLSLRWDKSSL